MVIVFFIAGLLLIGFIMWVIGDKPVGQDFEPAGAGTKKKSDAFVPAGKMRARTPAEQRVHFEEQI